MKGGAIRIGTVGAGGFGLFALQHFTQIPGVELIRDGRDASRTVARDDARSGSLDLRPQPRAESHSRKWTRLARGGCGGGEIGGAIDVMPMRREAQEERGSMSRSALEIFELLRVTDPRSSRDRK